MSLEEQSLNCDTCDQRLGLNRNYDDDEQLAVRMLYRDLQSNLTKLELQIRDGRHAPGILINIKPDRIIVEFYYIPKRGDAILTHQIDKRDGMKRQIMHISLFPDGVGGVHTTIPESRSAAGSSPPIRLYLTNEHILTCLGHGKKYYTLLNYLKTWAHYFNKEQPITRPTEPLDHKIQDFINKCLARRLYPHVPEAYEPTREEKKKQLVNLLEALHNSVQELCEIDTDSNKRRRGGSTKVVLYLIKIEKLRELNKKLRKNKTKYKNKIQKNNKQIDELKIKIKKEKIKEKLKKEKAKAKEKLKKQKAKLKKQKVKKVHITKKIKK
tara:strand:+ start:117 stop:1091 length:975 start_codon:yes stop_codon:yes gene_type:complete